MMLCFATVARGLEALAAQELEQLGAVAVTPGFCGVEFQCQALAQLYRINLWARLPFRILVKIGEVACQDSDELYQQIQTLDWQTYLTPDQTLAVKATGKNRYLNHTHFTALKVKDAIVAQQQDYFSERSDIDTQQPDVLINVHIEADRAIVSLDSSGSSLHRRGYRPAMGAAPLKESLAAALIQLSNWHPDLAFVDPMCGSGTLPIEASLLALDTAPGIFRERFGFETWPNFEAETWQQLLADAQQRQRHLLPAPILGSDQDGPVIQQAQTNASLSGVRHHIEFVCQALEQVEPPATTGVIICNPPYGERLGDKEALGSLYKLLGTLFKERFKGWTAYVLSGNKVLSQQIGLKSAQRFPVYNGALPCQLMKYELY